MKQKIIDVLNELSIGINGRKDLLRVHKDNAFNRRFSGVSSTFFDVETILIRLEENIPQVESIERIIQERNNNEDKDKITEEGQELRKKSDSINRQNKAAFKCLYVFAKIFLDEYTQLIRFLFDWRGIGDKSITRFYQDLNKYTGTDKQIIAFRDKCLNKLEVVDTSITKYRDLFIVHHQTKHKETRWFSNDMRGNIKFLGGGSKPSSITPKELVLVIYDYILSTSIFVKDQLVDES